MTIFDCLNDIIVTKSGKLHEDMEFTKVWSNYIILRYLSMDNKYRQYATILNKHVSTFTQVEMYRILLKVLPKQNSCFISYIKKTKKSKKISNDIE